VVQRPEGPGINWALVLNSALLLVVVLGAWFTTFSNPLNDKFNTLDKGLSAQSQIQSQRIESLRAEILAQLAAQEKASKLSFETVNAVNTALEASLNRRFGVQDKGNDQLQKEIDDRFRGIEKLHDEFRQKFRDLEHTLESRRVEEATKADLSSSRETQRLEFLAEIKRVDQIATALSLQAITRAEFDTWRAERAVVQQLEQRRLDALATHLTERERDSLTLRPPGKP
jgi:hypothetical protein